MQREIIQCVSTAAVVLIAVTCIRCIFICVETGGCLACIQPETDNGITAEGGERLGYIDGVLCSADRRQSCRIYHQSRRMGKNATLALISLKKVLLIKCTSATCPACLFAERYCRAGRISVGQSIW